MSFLGKLFGAKRENEPARPLAEAPRPEPLPARMSQPGRRYFHPSGPLIAGRYEITGQPLIGGMGIVYICFDHQEQRPVALKTFKPEYLPDRSARERFLEEGNAWVRLGKHPHIVRCTSVFQDSPRPEVYLVLELIAKEEGRRDASLRAWLTPGKPVPVEQALLIALQIVRGMRHATETIPGFVHRDLKPENVLVGADRLSNAPINRVRVTDFGLVKGLRAEQLSQAEGDIDLASRPGQLTRAGSVLGTPPYMAPEQWEVLDVTLQADIYALGCILGEMLTGRILVREGTLAGYQAAHREGKTLAAMSGLPDDMRRLLAGSLGVKPEERYPAWAALEAALAEVYARQTGKPEPVEVEAGALTRAERVAAGWSASVLGGSYLEMGTVQAALDCFKSARAAGVAESERLLEGVGLGNLGSAYLLRGDPRQALGYYEQALAIHRKVGDRRFEGNGLGNLGCAYLRLGDPRQAIKYFDQALAIRREIGDRHGEGKDLGNLGEAYRQRSRTSRAIKYFEQALTIRREIGDRHGEGNDLGNLGIAHADLRDARRAIKYLEQALAIRRDIGDLIGVARDCLNLALIFAKQGHAQRALPLAQEAAQLFEQVGDADAAIRALQLAEELVGGAHSGPDPSEIMRQLASVISLAVAATQGDFSARDELERKFPAAAKAGWHITDPIHCIWAGERDEAALIAGLDASDTIVVREILRRLEV